MPTPARMRTDIEGLRALAVAAVVLYHLGWLPGGYAGVDVFFVISGFLITGLLWDEIGTRGSVSFANFYSRRVRRLLPASLLVIAVTVAAASVWMTPLGARSVVADGRAAALYVANFRFIALGTDYLAPHTASPLQHYWSLAVEEQFYLCWPLLLFAVTRMTRRASIVGALIAACGVASFALSLRATHASPVSAFYGLPTRAWELVAGALLALLASHLRTAQTGVAAVLGWVGLATLAWSFATLHASTPFPGTAALVPVAGAVAVIASGCALPLRGPGVVLGTQPAQVVGRHSYTLYLWHWPLLVIGAAALGHALAPAEKIVAVAAAMTLAVLTSTFVERPIRFGARLTSAPRVALLLGGVATATALTTVTAVGTTLPSLTGTGRAPTLRPEVAALATRRRGTAAGHTTRPGGVRHDPVSVALAAAVADLHRPVPDNLDPSLGRAAADKATPFLDGCDNSFTDAVVHQCVYGNAGSQTTIVLFGDSHAAQYFPAFSLLAKVRGWRLVVLTKATCPPWSLSLHSPVLGREFTECEQWREAAFARIGAEHPALVVVAVAHHYGPEYGFTVYGREWFDAAAKAVKRLHAIAPVLVFGPVPRPGGDVPSCLSAHLGDASACALQRDLAYNAIGILREGEVVTGAGGRYVDVGDWFCGAFQCPVIVGNLLVYRDDNHITTTYARWLSETISRQVDAAAAR